MVLGTFSEKNEAETAINDLKSAGYNVKEYLNYHERYG